MSYKMADVSPELASILPPEALDFLTELHVSFNHRRLELLCKRYQRQIEINNGKMPGFLEETKYIRDDDSWQVNPVPEDLQDRRVEITGPVSRKMIINALNSGAKVYMADFEDSTSPTWSNIVEGHFNVRDAASKSIDFISPEGKEYALNEQIATLMIRPRGWHLDEKHLEINGCPISASLFDFGLAFYHCAKSLIDRGSGPYFYLPKLQSHHEAELWNDVFIKAQELLGILRGTIKATVLIEHVLAAFEAEEILYELREHSAGLNCGRWDYIFSFIKTFQNYPEYIFPDRSEITMTVPFMRSYCLHVIKACNKRGAQAIGGMAAQIPIKNDPQANEIALNKVREDKIREAKDGCAGTWVAHPGLVKIAMDAFNEYMTEPHNNLQNDIEIKDSDIIEPFNGPVTEQGIKTNISVGVQYLAAWLDGNGCVPLYNLMEDLATCSICQTQIWQWLKYNKLTMDEFDSIFENVKNNIKDNTPNYESSKFYEAFNIFRRLSTDENLIEFLTLPAYELLSGDQKNE